MNVEKKLYVERISAGGSKSLQPVTEGTVLSVGDKIVARLTIRLDRTMDFVQLKDQRGACFEPIGSLSGYRWSNGLGYYAEVEDAATNFFFDHLGKGVYVLEHSYRIARGGTYETGAGHDTVCVCSGVCFAFGGRDNCNKVTIEYGAERNLYKLRSAILGTLAKNTYFCPTNIE